MDIKEIRYVNKSLQSLGLEKTRDILIDWVYNKSAHINSINSDEMVIISGYSKWTYLTEASLESVYTFIGYILDQITKDNKKQLLRSINSHRKENKETYKLPKFTEMVSIKKPTINI